MTGRSEESNEETSISTEVEEEERVDTEKAEDEDDRNEAVRLEKLDVQLEEDSDLLESERVNDLSEGHDSQSQEEEEKRQDENCPFCDFMRLGPCGKSFSTWEECTEMAEEKGSNVFEKCSLVTGILTSCMRANLSYYGPVLEAHKGIEGPSLQAESMVDPESNAVKNSKSTDKQVDIQDEAEANEND